MFNKDIKVLILGQGLLGSALTDHWRDVADISTWRTQDIQKFLYANRTARSVMLKPYEFVVNCAVSKKELDVHRIEPSSVLINSLLPLALAESINIDRCFLIHFSTDQFALERWENGYAIEKTIGDILLSNTQSIILRGAFFSLKKNTHGFMDFIKAAHTGNILSGYVNVYSRAIDIQNLLFFIDEILLEQESRHMVIGYGTDKKYQKYELIRDVLKRVGLKDYVVPSSKIVLGCTGEQHFPREFTQFYHDEFKELSYASLIDTVAHFLQISKESS